MRLQIADRRLQVGAAAFLAAGLFASAPLFAQTPDGSAIFARECATCHTGAADTRAPAPDILRRRSPEAILSALTAGGMRPQGGRLTGAERRAVAEYLTGRVLGGDVTGAQFGKCTTNPPLVVAPDAPLWGGWSPTNANTRFQTAAQAGLTDQSVPKLTLKWAFGFPDATSAWSQPTVAGGRLYLFSGFYDEGLHATARSDMFDPETGAWTQRASVPVAVCSQQVFSAGADSTRSSGRPSGLMRGFWKRP